MVRCITPISGEGVKDEPNFDTNGKICARTQLNGVNALPIALMSERSLVNSITKFTPYELSNGRQFPGPTVLKQDLKLKISQVCFKIKHITIN